MIEIKATKAASAPADPAERYVFKGQDQRSRTPLLIGLMLAGLAVYLRSIFPAFTKTEGAIRQPGEKPENISPEQAIVELPAEQTSPETTSSTKQEAAAPGSGKPLIELQSAASFSFAEGPDIRDFFKPEHSVSFADFSPSSPRLTAINDNASIPEAGPGSGVGGGVDSAGPGPSDGSDGDNPPQNGSPAGPPAGSGGNGGSDPGSNNDSGDEGIPPNPCGCAGNGGGADDEDDERPATNRAPRTSGPVYLLDVTACAVMMIGLNDLLRGAHDPDGDTLQVQNLSVSAGFLHHIDGVWQYRSTPFFTGSVTISYTISDGTASVAQTATFSVIRSRVDGTEDDDILLGTDCADDIEGLGGDDNIDARGGNDVINGGAGNDHIIAGAGNDIVFGGPGNDVIFGGSGNDHIAGGPGDDRIFGEDGDDILFGDEGDDFLSGGAGNDLVFGGPGNDTIHGDAGRDVLYGNDGDDRIHGGDGDDIIFDGGGADFVYGGPGDDLVVAAMDGDDDVYDGGAGYDTLDYSAAEQSLVIDLATGTASGIEIGNDSISGFEKILGGNGDDHFILGDASAVLTGGGGQNSFDLVGSYGEIDQSPVFEITDFKVGDKIKMQQYKLFEKIFNEMEDVFENVFGNKVDEDDFALRLRHEIYDGHERTVIEADYNRDDVFETTVYLQGRHVMLVIEHV